VTDDDVQARIAARLLELRRSAGLTGTQVDDQTGISQSKLSKVERRLLRPAPDDVAVLCELYGAATQERDELVHLAETLHVGTIEPPRITLSRGARYMQDRIRRLEGSATLLRSFQPCMVIGLVQTAAYASMVFGAAIPGSEVSEAVAARMKRQEQLRTVPHAVLIMTEGALRWQAGSPQIMIDQIAAIAEAITLPNVEIGVIPFSAAATFFPRHGWHLYDSDAVIIGTESGTATVTDGQDVAKYERMFDRLQGIASLGEAALPVLDRIAADYRALA
jgi:transcriptional regulator with XRE-family HTH domain